SASALSLRGLLATRRVTAPPARGQAQRHPRPSYSPASALVQLQDGGPNKISSKSQHNLHGLFKLFPAARPTFCGWKFKALVAAAAAGMPPGAPQRYPAADTPRPRWAGALPPA